MPSRRRATAPARVAGVLLFFATFGACVQSGADCTPTRMEAVPADKVDLTAPLGSAVLAAKLTDGTGRPLAGKNVGFQVTADGAAVYSTEGSTAGNGRAAVDLKGRVEPSAIVGLARGDAFVAGFSGDPTYCSSADTAPFRVIKAPGLPGVPRLPVG